MSVAPRPAGFWIRAVAALVDLALFFMVQRSLTLLGGRLWGGSGEGFTGVVGSFTLLFAAVYAIVLHAGPGQTLGKLVVGARVVDVDGGPAGVGPALLRWFGYFLSGATFGAGFVIAGLRRDKRALHDLVAGTRVERMPRRRPVAGVPPTPPPGPPAVPGEAEPPAPPTGY